MQPLAQTAPTSTDARCGVVQTMMRFNPFWVRSPSIVFIVVVAMT